MKLLIFLLFIIFSTSVFGGAGTFPKGPRIKALKNAFEFKVGQTRITATDPDDPTVVAKQGDPGSMYIQSPTGQWFQKQDSGVTTNWVNALTGPVGNGTDNHLPRWDGTGTPSLKDSVAILDDLGNLTNLLSVEAGGIRLVGGVIQTISANQDLTITPNGTGDVIITTDVTVTGVASYAVGTALLPAIYFGVDNDTGIYHSANDEIALSTGGVNRLTVRSTEAIWTTPMTVTGLYDTSLSPDQFVRTDGDGGLISTPTINLVADIDGILPIANGGTNSGTALSNERAMVSQGGSIVEFTIGIGEYLSQDSGGNLVSQSQTGTLDQVILAVTDGDTNFSLPQSIGLGSSPTFQGMTLTGLSQGSILFSGSNGEISEDNVNFNWDDLLNSLNITGGVTLNGQFNHNGNLLRIGNTDLIGDLSATGDFDLIGNISHSGNYDMTGDLNVVGNVDGNTVTGDFFLNTTFSGSRLLSSNGMQMVEATPLGDGNFWSGFGGSLVEQSLTGTDNQLVVTVSSGLTNLSLPQDITPTSDVVFNSAELGEYLDISQTGAIANPPVGKSRIGVKTDGNAYIRQSGGSEKVLTSGDVLSEVCLVRDVQSGGTAGGDPGGGGAYITVTRDLNTLSGTCGHVEIVGTNQFRLTPSGSFCMEAKTACYDSELTSAFLFNTTDNTVVGSFNYPVGNFCSGIAGQFGTQNVGDEIEVMACATFASPKILELRWHGKRSNDVPSFTLGIPYDTTGGTSDVTATGDIEVHSLIKVEKFQ